MTATLASASADRRYRWVVAALAVVVLVGLEAFRHPTPLSPPRASLPAPLLNMPAGAVRPMAQGHLPMPANTPSAHASNLLAMPKGHRCALLAFWFAGTRESAPDVQIISSCMERSTQQWQPPQVVVNRHVFGAELGMGLRRVGNPVSWRDAQGRVHLFVVATGLGGWAASRIVHLTQIDDGRESGALAFGNPQLLPLSWLWNTSMLVRAMPMPLQDGGMLLPVYFELGIKFPVALRFGADGKFVGSTRLSQRRYILQPYMVPLDESRWLALMRDNRIEGKVAFTATQDAGQHWVDLPETALINPDSSVAALALAPGLFALAHNSSPRSRQVLDLSLSADGLVWTKAQTLASGEPGSEFSYPSMTMADGDLWVSYTEGRTRIAWQRFALVARP